MKGKLKKKYIYINEIKEGTIKSTKETIAVLCVGFKEKALVIKAQD